MGNVSGRHAQIVLQAGGAMLSDVGSTNGTYLNEQKLDRPVALRPGSVFRLGMSGPSFEVVEIELAGGVATPENRGDGDWLGKAAGDKGHDAPRSAPAKPAGPVPMTPTRAMVVSLQKTNQRLTMMVAASIGLVLALLIGGGWYLFQRTVDLRDETTKLTDASKEQQQTTDQLKQKVVQVSDTVGQLSKSDEEKIFNNYGDAVFMVGSREGKGTVRLLGTAFAVRETGTLGTNAHIAVPVREMMKRGTKMVVFAPGGKTEYPIIASEWHKDYVDWPEGKIVHQTPDVGVLTVSLPPGGKLPKTVDLATDDDLRKLAPGSGLCYIGFPGWTGSDYNTLNKIVPYIYPGPLTRMMTLREETGDFANQYLLEHDMSTTGGASGSPIFNRAGKVVGIHNSGPNTYIPTNNGRTLVVPRLGPKTGMRIDLLKQVMK